MKTLVAIFSGGSLILYLYFLFIATESTIVAIDTTDFISKSKLRLEGNSYSENDDREFETQEESMTRWYVLPEKKIETLDDIQDSASNSSVNSTNIGIIKSSSDTVTSLLPYYTKNGRKITALENAYLKVIDTTKSKAMVLGASGTISLVGAKSYVYSVNVKKKDITSLMTKAGFTKSFTNKYASALHKITSGKSFRNISVIVAGSGLSFVVDQFFFPKLNLKDRILLGVLGAMVVIGFYGLLVKLNVLR